MRILSIILLIIAMPVLILLIIYGIIFGYKYTLEDHFKDYDNYVH